jgi:hypothetical protein
MVKQSRKKLTRSKRNSYRKRSSKSGRKARRAYGKMIGGAFTQEETQQLLGLGFTQGDIEILAGTGVGLNIIQMTLNQVNPATGNNWTTQEMIQSVHEANDEINQLDISDISNASDDEHNLNESMNNSIDNSLNTTTESLSGLDNNNSLNTTMDSLHLSDLNASDVNSSANTTKDDSIGGKKRRKASGKPFGKTRKARKGRKSHKQRGGTCYGNGVGANNYDPNFSIYNTRELSLFPYRPTN